MKKRKIKLDASPRGPAIELLADGQQFVACGTHSSGSRYQWLPELPSSIPTITMEQLETVWKTLATNYAMTPSTAAPLTAAATASSPSSPAPSTSPPTTEVMRTISEDDWRHLVACLRFLLPHAADEQVWAEVGMALLSIKDCGKPVKQLWVDFSRKAPNWEEGAAEQWWDSHVR
jgi:hypothetical protein